MSFKGKNFSYRSNWWNSGAIVNNFLSLDATVLGTGSNSEKLDLLKSKYPNLLTEQFDISKHEKSKNLLIKYIQA